MPSNRRNAPNQQPVRRPRVAGRRNRDARHGEAVQTETREPKRTAGVAVDDSAAADAPASVEVASGATAMERAEPASSAEPGDADAAEASSDVASPEAEPREAEPVEEASPEAEAVEAAAVAELPRTESDPESASTEGAAQAEAGAVEAPAKRWPWALRGAAVVLAGLAVWFGVESYAVRYTGPATNEALVSAGATSEVNGQVTDAVEKIFSYDFNDTAKTETVAQDVLVGPAVQRYNDLFTVIKQQAPQQQLIVTTTVKSSAVTRLEGDRAELLLFVDQHAMRANTGESNTGPAQLSVSAEKQGDRWKIIQLTLR